MKVLWLTWKDRAHPLAGGAETVNEELAKRLVRDGHEVVLAVAGFPGAANHETVDGYRIIRVGGRWTVYWKAYRYYRKHWVGWADVVIDEVNTMPFFAKLYAREPTIVFAHMLCREIWFYQLPLPFSLVGYLLEPLYLRLLSDQKVITVSQSTKHDILRYGFKDRNISIISEGIELEPVTQLTAIKKYANPTVLSLGAIRPMKKTLDQIKAFELAKVQLPNLKMKVAGDCKGPYGRRVLGMVKRSPYASDIEYLGKVSVSQKAGLMRRCHLITVTSVKEGWGLIVTEAASQGTPAIVYDVDGLRDSVRDGETGLVARHNSPAGLAEAMVGLFQNQRRYRTIRSNAWRWSKHINFEQSYQDFKKVLL